MSGERASLPPRDWRHVRTDRLRLDAPTPDDVAGLHAIHSDPTSWTHFPQGRHGDPAVTAAMVEEQLARWPLHGLGYWTVREVDGGPVVGWGGCSVPDGVSWWNLAYRFATWTHGQGYGHELARQALDAAAALDPSLPVVAYLLEHNLASRRVAERAGLRLVWRGPDAGNEDETAVRLVYADRDLEPEALAHLAAH